MLDDLKSLSKSFGYNLEIFYGKELKAETNIYERKIVIEIPKNLSLDEEVKTYLYRKGRKDNSLHPLFEDILLHEIKHFDYDGCPSTEFLIGEEKLSNGFSQAIKEIPFHFPIDIEIDIHKDLKRLFSEIIVDYSLKYKNPRYTGALFYYYSLREDEPVEDILPYFVLKIGYFLWMDEDDRKIVRRWDEKYKPYKSLVEYYANVFLELSNLERGLSERNYEILTNKENWPELYKNFVKLCIQLTFDTFHERFDKYC